MYAELRAVTEELTAPGGQFEVGEIERNGQRLKAFIGAPNSLADLWALAMGYADRDYLVFEDERITYTEAGAIVSSLAQWLSDQGVGVGDRVAIAMRNYPEWMLAYWATLNLGATVVGMNAWWVADELEYALTDSSPKVIIVDEERLEQVRRVTPDARPAHTLVVRAGVGKGETPWDEAVATDGAGFAPPAIEADSDAVIFYTSGTTGRPKGAQISHRAICNNVMALAFANTAIPAALARAGVEAQAPAPTKGPNDQLATLVVTPLFHVTANTCVALPYTLLGARLVFMRKWDAGVALKLVESERINTLSGVPLMSRELITHPDFESTDTSSLASLGGGGAQIQPDLVEKINKSGAQTQASTGYGMTEVAGVITVNSSAFFSDKPNSAGPPMPNFDIKVVDEDGNSVPTGERGELMVRGAQVINGYLNRPEATAEAIEDGWLHTGDIATLDEDGFVFLVDRAKDMVLRGGENVYCAEVEAAIHHYHEVAQCAVFAVPDDRLGEEVGMALVMTPGSTATPDDVREFAADRLAKHMIPRYIWVLEGSLPQNASGKFLKRELKETLDPADAS